MSNKLNSSSGSGSFARYRNALNALSARTGTPLASLALSFGVLHELTAIAPLIGVFYAARTFGVGERIVTSVIANDTTSDNSDVGWAQQKCRQWVKEGEGWAERVGRRYGFFGFDKGNEDSSYVPGHIAGDVANAVVAYGATKAMLPLRVGLSLYLAPMFSRRCIEPLRRGIMGIFR
ncbi:hypothetical protein BDP27DRAFT_1218813 [Rhodocollybia butyracea]|uniref:Uncharacterized protein n=1 Tax=Rhodocollybia butyracea TaxID=206335 RepID=A0A9P5PYM0_9AGAR|nr:hypothetical protein BDP27DRAFT_1218813 [Rhodocollybia butyracea]